MKIRNVSIILLVVSSIFINVLDAHAEESIKIEQFKELAEQGNADAQFNLGNCYYGGIGVEKDAVEAIKWYRKAADQGDARAQCSLGICYDDGIGVEKDAVEAIKWYRKAADQGNADGQYNLGNCYYGGIGVEKDAVEAIKWYRKAADQGDARAQCNLGFCYGGGIGVEKDAVEAIKWFRKAADQGDAGGQYNLGSCYYWGIGVEKDAVESIKWYRKAADQGYLDAFVKLGGFYRFGIGVEKDAVEAIKWYRKAADQGYLDAFVKLGDFYRFGIGVEKDAVEAIKWYRKAADQGDTFAKKQIDEYEAELKATEERRIAEEKAAEERRVAEEKRRVAACDEYWNGLASGINEHKTYKEREEYLQTVKSQLLHDNNDGTVLLDEFASEYLPNTFAKYEKAREKSLEIGQNLKSVFTKELDVNSPEWSTYLKATEKYSQILWDEKRIQNGISYIYLFHKVGAMSDEKLAALDKSEKMNFTFENDFKHDLNQYQTKKVDGVMEFAQKNMPETFALLETFEKEINETKVQFDGVYAEAEKLNYFLGNTTHSVFGAFEFKYRKTIEKYNAIMPQVKDLQVKHLLLEVTGDDLASQDSKIAKEHKTFKDSLPEFVKTNAHKGKILLYVE